MNTDLWRRAGRGFTAGLAVDVGIFVWGMLSTAFALSRMTSGSVEFSPLGLPLLHGARTAKEAWVQGRPGLLVLAALPLLAAVGMVLLGRPRSTITA